MAQHKGQWLWITSPKPREPKWDWQSREPVTEEMKHVICSAWRIYDDSDATFDGITHEEAVLARHMVDVVSQLKAHIDRLQKETEQLTVDDESDTPALAKQLFVVPLPTEEKEGITYFSKDSLEYCDDCNARIVKAFRLGQKNSKE
jgi:hypothetical protein